MGRDDKNDEMMKKVDEAWKETVDKDKSEAGAVKGEPGAPEATFGLFIYGLMMEAMIALGEIEHPVTKKKEANAAHAKFVIDTLGMLQSKTKGNLSDDEKNMLESVLFDLRMKYVQSAKPS
jgi:hypothetical protein